MADIFDVISDATRRDILALLLKRAASAAPELSVSDLVAQTQLTQPTVSKQLKVLRDAGLVSVREDGQHRYYRLDTTPLAALGDWLQAFVGKAAPSGGSSPRAAATEAQSILPEDIRTVAGEAGAAVASALFRAREAWSDLKAQATDAVDRATAEMRRRS